MSQSLSAVFLHAVFSTKNRYPFPTQSILREEMYAYIGGISKQLNCLPIIIGGYIDHVHSLIQFRRTITQAEWIKELDPRLQKFGWQTGYGVFSVSPSDLNSVRQYIANQHEHHRKITFQDEFRMMLQRHGLKLAERYVWD